MAKKGAIEVSFNWIFVLIAGAVILLFFISLVNTQKEKTELNIALTIKTELRSILTGAMLSESRQLDIDLPKIKLNFICEYLDGEACKTFEDSNNPGCYSQYEIGETGINEQTPSKIIFAPSKISGKKIITWALGWAIPFYVTNLLYVTGTNVKYIFVDDGVKSIELHNNFPEKTNFKLLSVDDLQYEKSEGNKNFKFIFTNVDPELVIISDEIISAAFPEEINAIRINDNLKEITFYFFEDGFFSFEGSTSYITDAEIYAAIFSDSLDFYSCNMQKAFNRLHIVAKVLKQRSELLNSDTSTPDRCLAPYNTQNNGLSNIVTNSKKFSDTNVRSINDAIPYLRGWNQETKQKSCPLIY